MKIGIVGGSIAGCSAAILLKKVGHQITVFERSNKPLVSRGGGIGTTPILMEQIRKDGLIQGDFAYFNINRMPFVGKSNTSEPFGKTAGAIPISFHVFQWNELWKNLRANIPNECYKEGTMITDARCLPDGKVELTAASSDKVEFDLVLFADGYNSLGRRILFPDKKLKYRGYVLWRGLLPESYMEEASPLSDEILRLSYNNEPGHNVVYFIPNQNGSVKEGERIFNWAAYVPIPDAELNELMTDRQGNVRFGTLPPGNLTEENETRMKRFLTKNIPAHYAKLVNKTTDSYIQVIYTLDLESYRKDRVCLIGDAGIVVQPFTGSGVFKGYNNVKDLINCMKENSDMEDTLEQWNKLQLQRGKQLLALGEQMENAFIWEQPDFAKVDEVTTKKWWKASITFPESFNFEKGGD
ncbi:FAD binding domain-containing protein [Echinicola shivajiensis]|uniref:FAD binding domain-containing protein n=1 Tax=Echinicola shivajiensis TaxID=1035916 RepID=UPI001BFCC280|nr:NAD-binding protein [Echinicola shivajiensis]